jgi:membrane protein implicated in regulation of membrane protease activity
MADIIPWIATVATIVAASMTAANLGARITGYGFCVFLVGSLAWVMVGLHTGQPALIWTDAILSVLNVFGIWRWLGVRAQVDDGARSAAKASEKTPGEALFPISLLSRATVQCQGQEVGRCVDAMAGSGSGRLDYVVVSHGGLAGVGETLLKLPWTRAEMDGELLRAQLDENEFQRLEHLPKDKWPGR